MTTAAMPVPHHSARHSGVLKLHRSGTFGEVSIPLDQPQLPTNPLISRTGTPLAIKYITSGVVAHSPQSTGRGGARNHSKRESHALTAVQIGNLKAAERHSRVIGLPFTRMISIHWEAAGVPLSGMAKATGRFLDLLTKALARHGSCTAWLWVHENCGPKGGHCHLLAYVPADLVRIITKLQRGWLRLISGQPYRKRVIKSRPIGARLGVEVTNPNFHAANVEAALAYMLKGANREAAIQFDLKRLQSGGRVIGKRCGVSQNIGPKARKAENGTEN